ncbi:MAG: putative rane protein [Firmicutes bacterium]|nr:putative rane protein [Bacillota bacterium]
MDKNEFIYILRQSLSGEVTSELLEQNVNYYDNYIGSRSVQEEERVISELGDPRLIAKTIIEADRVGKDKSKAYRSQDYTQDAQSNQEDLGEGTPKFGRNVFISNFKWYHKLIAILVVVVLFVLIAVIGRLIIGFLFAFGLPIILIILVMLLFRRR